MGVMSIMLIIGFDIAVRKSGISVLDTENLNISNYFLLDYKEVFDDTYVSAVKHKKFLSEQVNKFMLNLPVDKPIVFVVESLPSGGTFATSIKIAVAKTNLFHVLTDVIESNKYSNISVITTTVYEWKKSVFGSHNFKKELTSQKLRDSYSAKISIPEVVFGNGDLSDATSLSIFGAKKHQII